MAILTNSEAARFLLERDNFSIITHRRPDGDTLGSAALLCRGLRQLGKTAHVLQNPETTPKYAFLTEGLTKDAAGDGDTLVSVDVASVSMLPQCFMPYAEKIDLRKRRSFHHPRGSQSHQCRLRSDRPSDPAGHGRCAG